MKLFLDTGPLVARVSPKDAHHQRAVDLFERIADGEFASVHTSDAVVAEALDFVSMKVKRASSARALSDGVFGTARAPPVVTQVHRVHAARFATTLDRYHKKFDAGLSFTDWSTVVLLDELGIRHVASYDEGLAGFAEIVD